MIRVMEFFTEFYCYGKGPNRRRFEAFELWIWRRMEKIRWPDEVTNEEVFRRVSEIRQILNSVWPHVGSGVVRIDPLRFPAGCHKR